ncbi:hypothetical protein FRB93_013232 [Tulasnella sp. JGI-2019a]|nr:hypothetical protein FRB93_013232 [Tulasnella sp. JGI-2019a]
MTVLKNDGMHWHTTHEDKSLWCDLLDDRKAKVDKLPDALKIEDHILKLRGMSAKLPSMANNHPLPNVPIQFILPQYGYPFAPYGHPIEPPPPAAAAPSPYKDAFIDFPHISTHGTG